MPNVSTQQLVDTVAERTGLPKTQAKQALNAVLESLSEQLAAGNRVQLSGIPASKAVGFRAASQLKQRIVATDGE
jgi:DNA-binding protein HU-beta